MATPDTRQQGASGRRRAAPSAVAPDLCPASLAVALPVTRAPIVLDPAHIGGWFGGEAIAAWGPVERLSNLSVEDAAGHLDAAYAGTGHELVVVIAEYEGACTVLGYEGYLARGEDGWLPAGNVDAGVLGDATGTVPALGSAVSLMGTADFELDAAEYVAAVQSIQDSIRAGDVYLVNMTYRITGQSVVEPGLTYSALRARASSMMNAYVSDGERTLASVSPERFLSLESRSADEGGGNVATIWPIKGTRPRSECPGCDIGNAEELRASEKERAEHVMVVDLERNDLGRVSRTGSVSVDPLMEVAQTPYCHQMYSAVRSVVDGERPVARLMEAAFPCGSVTGTPKLAAMDAIRSLERSPRGPYTGSLIVARRGELDSSVLIRTLVDDGRRAEWGTGGGITIGSDPHEEWLETLLKAQPVLGAE